MASVAQAPPVHLKDTFDQLSKLEWTRIEQLDESLRTALRICRDATTAGGPNDPKNNDAHAPWLWLVHLAAQLPALGGRVAREWYQHLAELDRATKAFSPHRALAAYAAGTVEMKRRNDASARRWLHVAAIEDFRSGHHGAARTALLTHFCEPVDAVAALEEIVKAAPPSPGELAAEAEVLATKWYLKRDIRTSDASLDAEHELNVEVLKQFVEHINAPFKTTTAQGDALEELAAYLLGHIAGCFPVQSVSTMDFETDLVVRNLARVTMPALDVLGRYFLVECKNWAGAVGTPGAAYFANRVRYCRANTGILFAKSGITGEGTTHVGDARFTLHRSFSHDGIVIAVIDQKDLEGLVGRKETPLQLLLRKHDEVRFGTRA